MVLTQYRAKRKVTGGRYKSHRNDRQFEKSGHPSLTKIEKRRVKKIRKMGGNRKIVLLSTDTANLYDPKTKKYQKVKIKTSLENPANRHFVRRDILTKGAVVETEAGKAKITSRPGQDGAVNAVLIG